MRKIYVSEHALGMLSEYGQVCLSILGTWAGPSWTSLSTFRSVLFLCCVGRLQVHSAQWLGQATSPNRNIENLRLSIQSLLCANPLQNEPGHEHETGHDCDLYSATQMRDGTSWYEYGQDNGVVSWSFGQNVFQ